MHLSLLFVALLAPTHATPSSAAAPAAVPSVSPAPTATVAPAPALEEPHKHEVLQALFRQSSSHLTELRYCGFAMQGVEAPTLGDWLGKLFADMESGDNTVETACDAPKEPSLASASWTCHVDLVHADGDDHWKWGFEMKLRADDHSLVKGSLGCTGE